MHPPTHPIIIPTSILRSPIPPPLRQRPNPKLHMPALRRRHDTPRQKRYMGQQTLSRASLQVFHQHRLDDGDFVAGGGGVVDQRGSAGANAVGSWEAGRLEGGCVCAVAVAAEGCNTEGDGRRHGHAGLMHWLMAGAVEGTTGEIPLAEKTKHDSLGMVMRMR
jgi:hypothetical protein